MTQGDRAVARHDIVDQAQRARLRRRQRNHRQRKDDRAAQRQNRQRHDVFALGFLRRLGGVELGRFFDDRGRLGLNLGWFGDVLILFFVCHEVYRS